MVLKPLLGLVFNRTATRAMDDSVESRIYWLSMILLKPIWLKTESTDQLEIENASPS